MGRPWSFSGFNVAPARLRSSGVMQPSTRASMLAWAPADEVTEIDEFEFPPPQPVSPATSNTVRTSLMRPVGNLRNVCYSKNAESDECGDSAFVNRRRIKMSEDSKYDFQIQVRVGVPLQKWVEGDLELEINHDKAVGVLRIPGKYREEFPLEGTVSYPMMGGTLAILSGKNSRADAAPSVIIMEDSHEGIAYLGGTLNLLDHEINEWLPHVLEGSQNLK